MRAMLGAMAMVAAGWLAPPVAAATVEQRLACDVSFPQLGGQFGRGCRLDKTFTVAEVGTSFQFVLDVRNVGAVTVTPFVFTSLVQGLRAPFTGTGNVLDFDCRPICSNEPLGAGETLSYNFDITPGPDRFGILPRFTIGVALIPLPASAALSLLGLAALAALGFRRRASA